MRIPKQLKIGAHNIKIDLVDEVTNDFDGFYNSRTNSIQIKKALPQSQKEVTLIHEILHCLCMQLRHEDVEWIAQGFYQVLRDNKLVFDGKPGPDK